VQHLWGADHYEEEGCAQGFRLDLKPLEEQPAAAVFCEHSGAAADDTSVQGICKILGGWPVGLRIAGRYLSSTGESAADYLGWLEQEPFKELGDGGHQEENAALLLRRSVAQVSDDARLALGVAGTLAFALIAREPLAAVLDSDERRARKAFGELVNYGLLETKEERWHVSHALVHTYARTELALSYESLERLAGYYINFCEAQSQAGLEGYARLDGERAHCLRLMESCLASKLWQEVKALVEAIQVYLDRQGWWTDREMAFDMSLTAAQQKDNLRAKALSLDEVGYTCGRRGELDKALLYHEQSLSIWHELRDRKGESVTLNNIAGIYDDQRYYEQALKYYQQSLMICREGDDRKGEGTALNNIARVYMNLGEWETALEYLNQTLTFREETGDTNGKGITLANIGMVSREQGNPEEALKHLEKALAIAKGLGDKVGEATRRWSLGLAHYDLGNLAEAVNCMSQTVKIEEDIGHPDLENDRRTLARVQAEWRRTQGLDE
jgi:tetratricopeptide (TPR) repeat protein